MAISFPFGATYSDEALVVFEKAVGAPARGVIPVDPASGSPGRSPPIAARFMSIVARADLAPSSHIEGTPWR